VLFNLGQAYPWGRRKHFREYTKLIQKYYFLINMEFNLFEMNITDCVTCIGRVRDNGEITSAGMRTVQRCGVVHQNNFFVLSISWTASVVYWSEFLAADPEVPGSIPGAARFSE
jgi:hypothetical protein